MSYYLRIVFVSLFIPYVTSYFNFEELQSSHYGIDISDTPLLRQEQIPSDAIVLSSKYGQLYQCAYPPPAGNSARSRENSQASNLSVVELLSPMKQTSCLIFTKGWWTYEFCFGRELKQYHSEDGKIVGDILSLGYYKKDINSSAVDGGKIKSDLSKQGRHKSVELRYHRQTYVNGTHCDLTGKARSTEARFVCQEGHGDYVAGIDERETCSYVITIHTSRICSHPHFGPMMSAQYVSITCSPLLSSADYDNYMRDLVSAEKEVSAERSTATPLDASTENADSRSTPTSSIQEEETPSNEAGPEQNTEFEKLFFDSLVHGMRAAMGNQDEGQAASDTRIKIVKNPLDLDSILKSMLLEEGERSDDQSMDSTSTSNTGPDQSVMPSHSVDSNTDKSSDADEVADSSVVDAAAATVKEEDAAENAENTINIKREDNEDDVMDEEDEEFLREFDEGLDKIAATTSEKARIAKYKENLHSAMSAMLPDLLQEGQDDMARQGEEAAVDAQVAFRKLAKTLNSLIQRLEHAGKDLDDDDSLDDTKSFNEKSTDIESAISEQNNEQSTSMFEEEDNDKSDKTDTISPKAESTSSMGEQAIAGEDPTAELSQPLVNKLKDRLNEAGLTTAGRKVEFRIITAGYYNQEDGSLHSGDDSSAVNKMIIAIIGDSDSEETKELERQQRLEDNYHFKYRSPPGGQKPKHESDDVQPAV